MIILTQCLLYLVLKYGIWNLKYCIWNMPFSLWIGVFPIKADCILGLIEEQSLSRKSSLEIGWIDYCSDLVLLDHFSNLFTNLISCDQTVLVQPSCFSDWENVSLCWLNMESDRRGAEEGHWRLIWHHLLLQNSWRALVQMFLVVDMDIELDWGQPIMVDTILFLIYGVTWCIGVTMPVVIFCMYRIFLRWGWDSMILEVV